MKKPMTKQYLLLVACLVLVSLSGCCTPRQFEKSAGTNVAKYQFQTNSLREVLAPEVEQGVTNADILVLSGGGSHGAWGAGVLRGWSQNQQCPRPKFRVVTGVSTGALLATYAFLGEPRDDDKLAVAYTNVTTSDIYRKKCPLSWLASDSLYSSSPLKGRVERFITSDTLSRVAKAGREENRRLYIGTVNLDTGKLVIWDMTRIAMDEPNPNGLALYRQVVLASASIPIWVPPVKIDGALYADGGVRAQLFFDRHFLPALRAAQNQRRAQRQSSVHLGFHVIVNGKVGVDAVCEPDCLVKIGERTLDMILDAGEVGDLYRIQEIAEDAKGRGEKQGFWVARIPQGLEVTSSYVFDPCQMKKLYDAGVEFGRDGTRWETTVPDPDQPSR